MKILGYLVQQLKIIVPYTNTLVVYDEDTAIRVDPVTHLAWVGPYQVSLTKHQYRIAH